MSIFHELKAQLENEDPWIRTAALLEITLRGSLGLSLQEIHEKALEIGLTTIEDRVEFIKVFNVPVIARKQFVNNGKMTVSKGIYAFVGGGHPPVKVPVIVPVLVPTTEIPDPLKVEIPDLGEIIETVTTKEVHEGIDNSEEEQTSEAEAEAEGSGEDLDETVEEFTARLNKTKKTDVVLMCEKEGLTTRGNKNELIERLVLYFYEDDPAGLTTGIDDSAELDEI